MTRIILLKFKLKRILYPIVCTCLSLIPKKRGLVLFTSWFGQKYLDNSKYVYEYFLDKTDYKTVWMTRDTHIYEELKKEGKPVVKFNSLKGLWYQIRTEAVFSSVQFEDYNTWLLSRCLYIDLGHGHPIKNPGAVSVDGSLSRDEYRMITNRLFYYSIVAGERTKKEYNVVPVTLDHVIISDYARNDVFEDEHLRFGKNLIVDEFKKGRKAIVYMPTHRSDGHVTMDMTSILPLKEIQQYCEKNSYVFIIKKHFYHRNEQENLQDYPNILDVTSVDNIDPQVLLYQADILISDYSACYVDYMLLRRPVVFFQYDLNEYIREQRSLYYDFDELQIAPVVHHKEELVSTISDLMSNGDTYLEKRMRFAKQNYFDNLERNSGREKVRVIFDGLYKEFVYKQKH